MILLSLFIILFVIGVILSSKDIFETWKFLVGMILAGVCGILLLASIICLLIKPYNASIFKIKYDVLNQTITSAQDIRDTNITQRIIEINSEIQENKIFVDNEWIGIFYNRQIAELELLEK